MGAALAMEPVAGARALERQHVLIVLDYVQLNGGQAKVALDSALGLAARGHRVTVFGGIGPADPRLAPAGIEVVCLDQDDITTAGSKLAFLKQVLWNGDAAAALRGTIARVRPSLIHLHGWAKVLSPSVASVIARAGLPIVYTFHDYYLFCPNGGFYDYAKHEACHRKPLSGACLATQCDHYTYAHKLMRSLRTAGLTLFTGLAGKVGRFITISDLQESVARPHLPAGAKVSRLGNPIDVSDPGPRVAADLIDAPFLYAGRISPEKGLETFLEAARIAGLRVRIVGDGPEAPAIRARFPEMDYAGWKSGPEVQAEMRRARALVFPSLLFEGQPLTVLEALAMGTPVIVSDACAGRESIEPGVNGAWFKVKDAQDLAARLRDFSDDALVARMSAAAHARYWASPLTLDRHIDGLEAVYARTLAERVAG
jgi:glycosyltransferase involved in cell wall biosynthesis